MKHGIQKPAWELETKNLRAADYEEFLSETNQQRVTLVLFLNQGPVNVLFPEGTTASNDKQQLPAGTRLQVTAFKLHKERSFIWVASATKPQSQVQGIGGYVTVDQLSQRQPAVQAPQGQLPNADGNQGGVLPGLRNLNPFRRGGFQ